MLQRLPTLDELPYNEVIELVHYKEWIDEVNHIAERTRLLYQHPELFNRAVVNQIKTLHKMATRIANKYEKDRVLFIKEYLAKRQASS